MIEITTAKYSAFSNCSAIEFLHEIGDGICQDLTNTKECEYDQGDCCLPQIVVGYCDNCSCHENPDKCPFENLLNNGICDAKIVSDSRCSNDKPDCKFLHFSAVSVLIFLGSFSAVSR